ncbi:GAF domain-containing sensor histidine kinase [Demequina aurantiaca]|uniref:GAF domain-containing sensor histidine kinase n=1 Tax=Demequina aurantiaca TaxID=676200 RepID=UPI0007844CDB|nr:GAF domain-containing protein [Demequina aurantiaca]
MNDDSGTSLDALTHAIVGLNAKHELAEVLAEMLDASVQLTGAQYAAINQLDANDRSVGFQYVGMDASVWDAIGRAPSGVGVLHEIPQDDVLMIDEITSHPAFLGLPPGHPPLGAFLGTRLRVRDTTFGYLYLANKDGGFNAADGSIVRALAAAASVAIDNAKLYSQAVERQAWLEASNTIVTSLLSNPEDESIFTMILDSASSLARATHSALALPGVADRWVLEFTGGPRAHELLGLNLPENGPAMQTVHSGVGLVSSIPPGAHVLEAIRDFGPAMYAPLRAGETTVGLLMLWRERGAEEFLSSDLATAQRFATDAAIALGLAEITHLKHVAGLSDERQRIADDLHDFVSQELFATSIQLEGIAADVDDAAARRLNSTLEHVRRAQYEVRGVMSALAGGRSEETLTTRLEREVTLARETLGFAPRVDASWDEVAAASEVDRSLADDAVAVMRELLSNVARHANASAAWVTVKVREHRLEIQVSDNGRGASGATVRHSGTSNLANRAIRRDGTFSLEPRDPGADNPGTVATWIVRVDPNSEI